MRCPACRTAGAGSRRGQLKPAYMGRHAACSAGSPPPGCDPPPPPRAQMAKAASRHTTGAAHAGTVTPMLQARLGAAADARRALQPPCCCSCCPGGVLCRAALRSRQPVRSGLLPLCAERRNAASTCACCPPAFPGLRCCRMPYNHAVAAGPSDVGMMQVSAVPSINHTSDIHREAAGGAQGGL